MLHLLEEDIREEIAPWEKDVLAQCERLGGGAARAAIASAIFAGRKRVHELGYRLADSPFDEPEIVRAAWIWYHLESKRSNPPLADEDLKRLLQGLQEPDIRAWCLAFTSYGVATLPESFQGFLDELGKSSGDDAEAIRVGAEWRQSNRPPPFLIHRMVS